MAETTHAATYSAVPTAAVVAPAGLRRISWGAVLAGAVIVSGGPSLAQPARRRHRAVDGGRGGRRCASGQRVRPRRRDLVGRQQPRSPGHRRLRGGAPVRHAHAWRRHRSRSADLGGDAADHGLPADHGRRRHHGWRVQRSRQHAVERWAGRRARRCRRPPKQRTSRWTRSSSALESLLRPEQPGALSAEQAQGELVDALRQIATGSEAAGSPGPRAGGCDRRPARRHQPRAGQSADLISSRPKPSNGPSRRRQRQPRPRTRRRAPHRPRRSGPSSPSCSALPPGRGAGRSEPAAWSSLRTEAAAGPPIRAGRRS